MTLTGMKKHVGVLEQAGLVTTEKVGRVRTCKLGLCRLEEEAAWIEQHRQLWSARFDALDQLVEHLKRKEKADAQRKNRSFRRHAPHCRGTQVRAAATGMQEECHGKITDKTESGLLDRAVNLRPRAAHKRPRPART